MRLAAVFISDHFLLDEPQVINFGAKFIYHFKKGDDNLIEIISTENKNYIDGFWNKDVSLISAIVGANGSGKTSILKVINKGYQEHTKAIFVYESDSEAGVEFYIDNRFGNRDEEGRIIQETMASIRFNNFEYQIFDSLDFSEIYFSPIFDSRINEFHSPLPLKSTYLEKNLNEIFAESVRRDVIFLNSDVSQKIKDSYPDFPTYESIYITAKKLYKRDFTKVYIDSNLGNPRKNETLQYTIERDLRVENFTNPESLLKSYLTILTSSNVTDALKDIWEMPLYLDENSNTNHLVHDSSNFLRNIEINILSFLTLNDTYIITELTGSYDFQKILDSTSFTEILDKFLAKYIVQTDKAFYSDEEIIRVENHIELLKMVEDKYKRFDQLSGIKTDDLKEKITYDIKAFVAIKNFYDLMVSLSDQIILIDGKSILKIDIGEGTEDLLNRIFGFYRIIREYFSRVPISIIDFIDIDSDKNLSYGEKSILNLYSTFYDYTVIQDHLREFENYLIILDEADLGYHPLWKRKFINTLNETLPIIFNDLTPKVWNQQTKKKVKSKFDSPQIQIIIATHDPLTLSDFPSNNIVYLKKDLLGKAIVFDSKGLSNKSFGANITDLLADSFFIEDGLIGDFAKNKIEMTIAWINAQKKKKEEFGKDYIISSTELQYHESIIKIIDEPVIKIKLAEMLDELNDQTVIQKALIQREIDLLNEKLKGL
jgi:hypothetical protein